MRRHPSEGIFGVQLAGNKPATLVPAAEAIARECGPNIDFVDLNCGCPIDLVFKSGSGSAREFHNVTFFHSRSELRGWEWRDLRGSGVFFLCRFEIGYPAYLTPTDGVSFSAGRAWKARQDPYRDEQSAWRGSSDDQASNWSKGWPQHGAQAHASGRFGMGCWVHDGEWYLLFDTRSAFGLLAVPRVHLAIDGRVGLTFVFFVTGSVARTHATAEVSETRGLGLHQRMRCCRSREGRRVRV